MKGTDGTQDKHGMQACITLLVCNLGKSFLLLPKKKILSLGSIVSSVAVLSAYVAILSLQYHHDHADTCSIVSR